MKRYAIGMDIGGTNSVFGIVDREGHVVCCNSIKTQEYSLIDDYVEAVSQGVEP